RVRNPAAVVAFMLLSGTLQGLYWIRQGGDFMHGRVLLAPLFCLLAPVAVIPVSVPRNYRVLRERLPARDTGHLLGGAAAALWLALAGWALWAANSPGMGRDATRVTYSGIVDERRFYSQATGHAHPLTAADYLDYPRMRAVLVAINNTPDGALLLPSGNWDVWDVVPQKPPIEPPPPGLSPADWRRQHATHTVFFTNLGMLGMNVGLNTRVIDQIGLANPLAAHTARLEDGRIGHDKNLFPDWAVAEGPWLKERPWIPEYLDEGWVEQAQAALDCPETAEMLKSIRDPMTRPRFIGNLNRAWKLTRYRIDRVPEYDLSRCGIPEPPPKSPPYTGLPATGP
ncbi:MAG: flagellar motor control protein ZomB, partial [Mycobacterium sp.]